MPKDLDSLPETITVPRTDAVYNCHAYLTKVPIGAIRPFVEVFSKPGETVVDFFAGSGMTGLAAQSIGRNAKLSDISVLGQHIGRGYMAQVPALDLRRAGKAAVDAARKAIGSLYQTDRLADGQSVEIVRTVWSFTYKCPACENEMVFFECVSPEGSPPKACTKCGGPFERRKWARGEDVPVEVVVDGVNGRQAAQPVTKVDESRIAQASSDLRLKDVPSLTIDQSREMYSRSGLGKAGMTRTADFFSARNGIALLELWQAINATTDEALRQKLRFAFTAILPRASKRYQWSAKRPLNAQNQTYYIAPVYYEWNVFELFERKVEASVRASDELFSDDGLFNEASPSFSYDLASADRLEHLEDASIDYVFTDPPFGSNIFYSDMSLFHEAWIGNTTDCAREAVVHTTGARKKGSAERYEALLQGAFAEAYRVLKPGRHMSVVFGNSSGKIWGLVQRALRDAGFVEAPVHVAILDKGQRSVKGLNSGSEGVVTVDLIVTVQKPTKKKAANSFAPIADTAALIREAVAELSVESARNPSHVYARVLRKAIQHHAMLDDLHLGDVLIALRDAGYTIDRKTGLLTFKSHARSAAA